MVFVLVHNTNVGMIFILQLGLSKWKIWKKSMICENEKYLVHDEWAFHLARFLVGVRHQATDKVGFAGVL